MELNRFQYQDLTESDSFRLIELEPNASYLAPLQCALVHTTLSRYDHEIIDHYTALSYVWGDPSKTGQISVNRQPVLITATLDAALRDLRDGSRIVRVWADALCINQSNITERNQQVQQMQRIYSTAHHTVIHLGAVSSQSKTVMQAIPSKSSGDYSDLDSKGVTHLVDLAIHSLLNRPWFGRVWVFQELVLSRDPWIQCGQMRCRWTDFCDLLLTTTDLPDSSGSLEILKEMNSTFRQSTSRSLFNLLQLRRGLGATDPRDLVFAHLGIAQDRNKLHEIKIHYRETPERVYEDAARFLLETIGPVNMFIHMDDVDPEIRLKGLASWAPDWRIPRSYSVPMYFDSSIYGKNVRVENHFILKVDPPVFAHIGYQVDIISNVGIAFPKTSRPSPPRSEEYEQAVKDLQAMYVSVGGTYASGDKFGQYTHISLGGKEAEHERLCRRLRDEWMHLVEEDLSTLPSIEATELESHKRLVTEFKRWSDKRPHQIKLFVGSDSKGFERLMYFHLHPQSHDSVLDGRKLTMTKDERVGIVPSQARNGDIVVYFAGCSTATLLRKREQFGVEQIDNEIIDAFGSKIGDAAGGNDPFSGLFVKAGDASAVEVEHCTLIGECYIEGLTGWPIEQEFEYRVFAMH